MWTEFNVCAKWVSHYNLGAWHTQRHYCSLLCGLLGEAGSPLLLLPVAWAHSGGCLWWSIAQGGEVLPHTQVCSCCRLSDRHLDSTPYETPSFVQDKVPAEQNGSDEILKILGSSSHWVVDPYVQLRGRGWGSENYLCWWEEPRLCDTIECSPFFPLDTVISILSAYKIIQENSQYNLQALQATALVNTPPPCSIADLFGPFGSPLPM